MPGLDPGIHDEALRMPAVLLRHWRRIMDCRVKPGNDRGESWRPALSKFDSVLLFWLLLPLPAVAEPVKIVALGDSATSGWLVPHDNAYPAQLQRMLRAKGYDVIVKNAGIAGDTTRHALKRFDLAIDPDTDIVLLELGTNDLRLHVARATMERNVAMLIESLEKRRIAVLVIGLGSLDLSDVAKARGVAYAQWRLPPGKYYRARDGAHFNAEGYRIVLERTLPQIEDLIRARQRPMSGR